MDTYYEYEPLFLKNTPVYIRRFIHHNSCGRIHWHEAIELLYFTQGKAVTGCNLQEYQVKKDKGLIYVLEDGNTVNNITDLEGKTIYCPAQNPTFILQYILKQNNINATIDSTSYAAPADLRNAVANGTVKLAVLPEPMVTIVLNSTK